MDKKEIIEILKKRMMEERVISISSKEYGTSVIGVGMPTMPDSIIWMFRPIVLEESKFMVLDEEFASEWPGMPVKIKRPKMIKVRYMQPNGETITMDFQSTTARCIMQEIDRMGGITIKDHANRYHWDQALKKFKKRKKNGYV